MKVFLHRLLLLPSEQSLTVYFLGEIRTNFYEARCKVRHWAESSFELFNFSLIPFISPPLSAVFFFPFLIFVPAILLLLSVRAWRDKTYPQTTLVLIIQPL